MNVFTTAILLRMIPSTLHPVAVWFLPSSYGLHRNLRAAKFLVGSLVEERRSLETSNSTRYQKPADLLQWMMDAAIGEEAKPDMLAHRQLLLTVASVHTTTVTITQAVYDLCANPELFPSLREEIEQQLGGENNFNKAALGNMRKLDSFMKESQRMNPITIRQFPSSISFRMLSDRKYVVVTFDRLVKESITLSDGLELPRDTHFSVASAPILMDPAVIPNPEKFDPLRSYRKRLNAEEANRYQFASTAKNDLHFGHGKYACPGRFFAANEIKMVLSYLILHYDLEYLKGQGRPINRTAHEAIYPDLNTRLKVKRRSPVI